MMKNGIKTVTTPKSDCGNQRWMLKPVVAYQCNKSDGERDANHVVGDPSYRTFCALLWSRYNI